ncbi:Pdz domain protein, related, related [Eimeria tenella]|uniref:Pdz domain protein, related, related n=1 Tax=Eimeria tenella TaxID=5802 RepID=U6KXM5_EIMTE|nr:Pdz domain protein, related, related [Eimeria tenella]CDJ41693.1 Pdz domain protein, related, related [Eimeria tenella]|eukprot:XP_013232443.1 Pdz domain protein, related, related [Eimeria tenella]
MGTSRMPGNTSGPYGPPGAANLIPSAGATVADPPAAAIADLTAALMSTAGFAASRLCVPPCSSVSPSVAAVGSPAVIAEAANDEWVVVIQVVYAFRHAAVAVLVQEALQCLLWGSDSDVQVAYELRTLDQLEQQREQQLQNQEQQPQGEQNRLQQQAMLQALDAGAVEVRVLVENRGGATSLNGDDSSSSSCIRRKEKGRVLAWSLDDLAAAADLVVPAASRTPDGAFAVRTAAAALEHQKQQPLQQNLLLLQRSRAALPLRKGALWSFLLSAETAAKLRHKAGEDVLPLAVQAVKSAPLLPLAWCTLGHSLRLRGRFWESNCCYKVASHLRACHTAAVTEAETATSTAASAPRAALAAAAAAAATVSPKLTRALENTLVRARMDPKELRKALPTLIKAEVEAPWGFAFDSNPREVGGIFVAYVVEGSKAEKAGLVPGDQIVLASNTILLGLPVEKCVDLLRPRRRPKPQQREPQLLPLKLEVYRGPLPLLYGASGFAALQRLDAVERMGEDDGDSQHYKQQQQTAPFHVPAGFLNTLLQGSAWTHQELF